MNEIPMLAKKKQGKMKQMWQKPSGGVQEGPKNLYSITCSKSYYAGFKEGKKNQY